MAQSSHSGEDRFVETSLSLLAWAQRNTRALVLGIGAVAILAFGVMYFINYRERVRQAAAIELQGLLSQAQFGEPGQLVDAARAYLVQFGGTEYADEARVLLAQSLLLGNRAAEAIEPARRSMEKLGDDVIASRAAFLLAAAYEEVGDTAAAISVYERIGRDVDFRIQRTRALEAAARLYSASGESGRAIEIYERLQELTPEQAPARAYYGMRAAELRAQPVVSPSEASASSGG